MYYALPMHKLFKRQIEIMAKLKNTIVAKMKAENRISHLSKEKALTIHKATAARMKKYDREYSKKEKASHIAASKVFLTLITQKRRNQNE